MHDLLEDPLVRDFEAATLEPAKFRHRQHLYVAWCLLSALPFEEALERYVGGLKKLTTTLGVPEKFQAAMTRSYLVLLDEAMRRDPHLDFDALLAKNPSLFIPPKQP